MNIIPDANRFIRKLDDRDIEKTQDLSSKIGWGDTAEDWKNFIAASKGNAFAIVDNSSGSEKIIATALGIMFPDKIRIASVLADPAIQRQGLGTRIFKHLLHTLPQTNLELDASAIGKPLYEKYGFVTDYEITAFVKQLEKMESKDFPEYTCTNEDLKGVIKLDAKAFGSSREELIRKSFESANTKILVEKEDKNVIGFLVYTKECNGVRIGPWIHANPEGAERLLHAALSKISNQFPSSQVTLHSANEVGLNILLKKGFKPSFTSYHMHKGTLSLSDRSIYFGIWTLGLG